MELRQKILQKASKRIITNIVNSGQFFSALSNHLNLEFYFLVLSEDAPDSSRRY